jgi:hypothetical protein
VLRSVPDDYTPDEPDTPEGACPVCRGLGVVNITGPDRFGVIECDDGTVAVLPTQEFQVGDRVVSHTFTGTVSEYVPQVYTDNLYKILWDADPLDGDLYPAHSLSRAVEAEAA